VVVLQFLVGAPVFSVGIVFAIAPPSGQWSRRPWIPAIAPRRPAGQGSNA
jgi:hypothetical protein